jgi:2-isopropylmalate synthase
MHVAGVSADPSTFEHIQPEVVGNDRAVLVSELSGKGTIHARAAEARIELDDGAAARLIERVKDREHEGYHYEAADGSFELLMRKESGDYSPLFTLESWRVTAEQRADGHVETEATIKLWVEGERYLFTAEGNGPVSALDRALRGALASVYPELDAIKLVNFKVRILDGARASDAITRVLLDSSDGEHEWGAIGVSDNVIEASWEALVDSLELGMQSGHRPTRADEARAPS